MPAAISVWDVATGNRLHMLQEEAFIVEMAQFSTKGDRLFALVDGTAKIWDFGTGAILRTFLDDILREEVGTAQLSPDGARLVTGGKYGLINMWDIATGTLLWALSLTPRGQHTALTVHFSPDSTRVITTNRGLKAQIWDAATGVLLRSLAMHKQEVISVQFSPDGALIATASSEGVRLWDAALETRSPSVGSSPGRFLEHFL